MFKITAYCFENEYFICIISSQPCPLLEKLILINQYIGNIYIYDGTWLEECHI
jgi:hypothetical protein